MESQESIIIILGKGINEDGTLTEEGKRSVRKGADLFKTDAADKIIMSGRWSYNYTYTPKQTEAEAMRGLAVRLGVPKGKILIEKQSLDTAGNAFFTKKIIKKISDLKSITVITVDYHVDRSRYIFHKIFGDNTEIRFVGVDYSGTSEMRATKNKFESNTLSFLKKIFDKIPNGNDKKIAEVFYKIHPLYAKDSNTVPEWVWKVFESNGAPKAMLIERYYKKKDKRK